LECHRIRAVKPLEPFGIAVAFSNPDYIEIELTVSLG
jgi:hypothetical protein